MSRHCRCLKSHHEAKLVVVTGAPGSGKTAVLEVMRHVFCEHVLFLPPAARMVLQGNFPGEGSEAGRRALQRAIFRVQRELERMAIDDQRYGVIVCDRGTLDGAAYWPTALSSFFEDNETTHAAEAARYGAVIHLRIPPLRVGYDSADAAGIERKCEAAEIDATILSLWKGHPHRSIVDGGTDFLDKTTRAISALNEMTPSCCRQRKSLPLVGLAPH